VIAIMWGWKRFAGSIVIAFFGPGRIGEVLRGCRKNLVLPRDTLYSVCDRCFLGVVKPKTGRRGGARTQHITVVGHLLVTMLDLIFGELQPSERLYPFTAATFRKRWDAILMFLKLGKQSGFTPGGLRGGGAVYHYQHDASIDTLMWKMRIARTNTLHHYLQEVVTATSLNSYPPATRELIHDTASLWPTLCNILGSP